MLCDQIEKIRYEGKAFIYIQNCVRVCDTSYPKHNTDIGRIIIIPKLNPGCDNCGTSTTLLYIRADGSQDTVHQLWDFTRGMPTIIYVISKLNTSLTINWRFNEPLEFKLSEKPLYSFAVTLDKLTEYNDIENNGYIDNRCPQRALSLRDLEWTRGSTVLDNKEAMLHMRGKFGEHNQHGVIDMKLDLLPFKDYAVDLPHLIHTANSTLVDVSLVNLTSSADYNASRFALHFTVVSTDPRNENMSYSMRKSLDDEHTPGVFEFDKDNLLVQDMFISFGLPGDGFYRQHNFTSWSFTIGYGIPPVESFSLFVIIIISIGLGVPILLALSGITFVIVRRCKQRNPPARFTDDE
ncbi:hypothetical protein HF086_009277 [Spodoptera exigua]|uniref:Lysosomal protein NCU-G1 n=1 Tax=Spodoptera exigua TaxID=7107 RepID=A0A922SEE8_SPOEX|nr:hypothetical protein HF086_009277 [Spodoptera exigua]